MFCRIKILNKRIMLLAVHFNNNNLIWAAPDLIINFNQFSEEESFIGQSKSHNGAVRVLFVFNDSCRIDWLECCDREYTYKLQLIFLTQSHVKCWQFSLLNVFLSDDEVLTAFSNFSWCLLGWAVANHMDLHIVQICTAY